MTEQRLNLGLVPPASGCSGDACACGTAATEAPAAVDVVARVDVTGMTCGHCVRAVTEEVSALYGVAGVDVDLVADGVSHVTVRGDRPVDESALREAIAEAGYAVVARA
ncbi:heavy-metal-associated domain-containing protein [Microbacterium sp. 10M-3C3]|jgi:copper chaperone CopZ|uniref:heavy-metal-associated domain-containing protein n=1 Tax=Microbacterium sp. 10M-3C3 TaxID=2483401 RepID=UPI000F6352F5|nr:heavy-metal-associated domain-containing protein [Microbacterium sp. 10M-3C3]